MKRGQPSFLGVAAAAAGWAFLASSVALTQMGGPDPRTLFGFPALLPWIVVLGGPGTVVGIFFLLLLLGPWARSGGDPGLMDIVAVFLAVGLGAANGALGLWLLQHGRSSTLDFFPFCIAGAAGGLAAGISIARSLRRWRPRQ